MSRVVYIKPQNEHDTNTTEQGVEVHAELLGNDIDALADAEQHQVTDNDTSDNIFGY